MTFTQESTSFRLQNGDEIPDTSAVDSKPTSGGRIKTSHFFSFKPIEVVLARGDLGFFG
jgi:hypothetical protein